jgi:hypothetical protein
VRSERNVVLGIVTLTVGVFVIALRLRLGGLPQGDEPHYLALAQAIVEYHTFDPTAVYANRDYWAYYPAEIDAHVAVVDGRPVPFHNIGAPLLFALPFLLWGRAGAQLVTLIAAVLTVVNIYRLQREHGVTIGYAGFVTVAFALGSPLYVYASMLFVEPIGMLFVIFAARVVLAPQVSAWRLMLASAGIGFLPWVHGRYAIFPVTFGVLFALRIHRQFGRNGVWPYLRTLLPMGVLAAGLEVFNLVAYHSLSPAPGSTDALGEGLLRLDPIHGLLYLAFDGRFGLFSNYPVLALALAGLLLSLSRAQWWLHLVLLGTVIPYAVAVATYPNWPGGYTPPGRLLSIVTPLFAVYVAVVLQRLDHWLMLGAAQLTVLYAFVLSVLSDIVPAERFRWLVSTYNAPLGRMAELTGLPVDQLAPVVTPDNRVDDVARLRFFLWCFVFAVITAILWQVGLRRRESTRHDVDACPLAVGCVAVGSGVASHGPGAPAHPQRQTSHDR